MANLDINVIFKPFDTTRESVQEDNFENQIVLLDGLSPKKNCPGPKLKIVLLDGLFFRGQKKALNSLNMKKNVSRAFLTSICAS